MDKVHPLTEIVARAICCGEHCTAKSVAEDCIAGRCVNQANAAIRAVLTFEPTEAAWGGLARDIVMWHDCYSGPDKTPRSLFKHLERTGREIPQWLRDEPELKRMDHVTSKGTRAIIIHKAMTAALLKEVEGE